MCIIQPPTDEVGIKKKRLAELHRIERAHDAYLAAANKMRVRQVEVRDKMRAAEANGALYKAEWCAGWLACLYEFSEEVVKA